MVEKIKTDIDRLLLVWEMKNISILAEYIGNIFSINQTKNNYKKYYDSGESRGAMVIIPSGP